MPWFSDRALGEVVVALVARRVVQSCTRQAEVVEVRLRSGFGVRVVVLTEGGEESQCGWLKDKFGLSWQIVPTALGEMLNDPDPEKAKRAMQAMLQMKKIDIQRLKDARDGVSVAA